jgi:hypothetical protein
MRTTRNLSTAFALVAMMVAVTSAVGAVLTPIGTLAPASGGTAMSWVSAISPDGTYAVGYSLGTNQAGTTSMNQPVIWSQATGLVQLPNASDTVGFAARGVAVRSNAGKIALAGSPTSGTTTMNTYEAPLSNLAGGTWTAASYGTVGPVTMGALGTQFNAVRADSTSGSAESWHVAGAYKSTAGSTTNGFRYGMDGAASAEYQSYKFAGGYYVTGYAVSGNGYMAGSDRGNGGTAKRQRAIRMDSPGAGTVDPPTTAQTVIPGGNHYLSEALGISADGARLCGYDNGSDGFDKAFAWRTGDGSMTLLGQLSGNAVSRAHVISDSGVVGGYSSPDTTAANFQAVIWDTTGTWDTTGQPMKVWDLLTAAGVTGLSTNWQSLTRVTSLSDDGMTIAGTGRWSDGSTRGWVATIPEPATLVLLSLAGLALRRRR